MATRQSRTTLARLLGQRLLRRVQVQIIGS
jgi:hypothetical protein